MIFKNNDKNIAVVIGSKGGIGRSIYDLLLDKRKYDKVLGFHRNSNPAIDISKEESIKNVVNFLIENSYRIKLFINAVGYLHDDIFSPEKKIDDINEEYIKKSFAINAISSAFLIKHFCTKVFTKEKSLFVSLSARVGSISDNYLGGWYSYRASKAALNQIIKTASIEFKRKKSNIIFLALHPGTVDTKLSKPFSNKKKLFSTTYAAEKILTTLEKIDINDSGKLIDYDGNTISY
tara:strand:- start:1092 stop:1796 length:705 start_codon:yes stop_codon:yes gene_type:complete